MAKMKNIYSGGLWLSDIDAVISSLPELNTLSGKSVLITGAGGLICSTVADVLIRWNESHNSRDHIRVIAAGRNRAKITGRFGEFSERDYFTFTEYDAERAEFTGLTADYVIHGAGNAHPSAMSAEPVETMLANLNGINAILKSSGHNVKRVLYISSSEVYGKRAENNTAPFTENDYGYVDILNPRSCYPIAKRAAETLCACYASEYGVDSVIVRPGHVYGASASENDSRVSSAFAYLAARRENIIMKSDGLQLRSWCYSPDCAGAILKVLLSGENSNAYNIPGEIMTIREMSETLARFGGVKVIREGASENEQKSFNPMNNSSVDGAKLEALGWKNIFDAQTGLSHTVEILREQI
ncbi:MAG: NAD-dependent epimerase/dehydratase family protein [Synergistaceae bacterium]|nr:NAD-dependent epimerase/dehydratase family protein [Synergistaceae bacterium]MBR0278516.1 NAD-dependent epimerase/dehydratase family protein [Synergistaceae bacterium]